MKFSTLRSVALASLAATFIGMAAMAPAARFDIHHRAIRAARHRIAILQSQKAYAISLHHFRRARELQVAIDQQRALIRNLR